MRGYVPARLVPFALVATLTAAGAAQPQAPAHRAWQRGQEAMDRDCFEEAIGQYQLSLRLDPALAQNHLSLAAAYLAQGEDARALPHLEKYLTARPAHHIVRLHYADLLMRHGQAREAKRHFERFAAEAQDHPYLAEQHLVHCHTRLMELAGDMGDEYSEHLNRGIGLYHLARRRAEAPSPNDPHCAEGLYFKAAAELLLARMCRPDEARPCWYLHEVWSRLAQRQPADRWLRAAGERLALSQLTPAERRDLALALRSREDEGRRK
jgi:tetratricopeptide (TPR) repeat protein